MANDLEIDALKINITASTKDAVKNVDSLSNAVNKLKNATKNIFKLTATVKVLKSAINESSKYVEDLNLFTVSMGEFAEEAFNYSQKVSEALGIDPSEFMRTQGVFMTLTKGFGVAADRANVMSKNLTTLGYDLSSFFNIDVADAMQKLQSGISGELEPLRRLGYDLSQAKLQAVALSLGIDKSINSMTQAEKAELRYKAILEQVQWAQGDMARTIDQPANQMRVLKQQVTQLTRALGDLLLPLLNEILPYLIATAKVGRQILTTTASLFGIVQQGVDKDLVDAMSSVGQISDELEDQEDTVKNIKKLISGFDELNILGSTDNMDDLDSFAFDLDEYDFLADEVSKKVDDITNKIREVLGLTGDVDEDTKTIGTDLLVVGSIIAGIVGTKGLGKIVSTIDIVKKFLEKSDATKTLTDIGTKLGNIATTVAGIAGVAAIAMDLLFNWDEGTALEKWEHIVGIVGLLGVMLAGVTGYMSLIVTAVAIMALGIMDYWDEITEHCKLSITELENAIANGNFLDIAKAICNGIVRLAEDAINTMINMINMIPFINIDLVDLPKFEMKSTNTDGFTIRGSDTSLIKNANVSTATTGSVSSNFGSDDSITLKNILSAIENLDTSVVIGDETIARSAARGNNSYKRLTGQPLIA